MPGTGAHYRLQDHSVSPTVLRRTPGRPRHSQRAGPDAGGGAPVGLEQSRASRARRRDGMRNVLAAGLALDSDLTRATFVDRFGRQRGDLRLCAGGCGDRVTKEGPVSLRVVASRFVRKVRTASGPVAVQVVTKAHGRVVTEAHGRVVEVEHVGSARSDAQLALLLVAAGERLRPGQGALDLGRLPETVVRLEDVADWTRVRDADVDALLPLASAESGEGGERGGRRELVAGGGRVLGTARCCCGTYSRAPTTGPARR